MLELDKCIETFNFVVAGLPHTNTIHLRYVLCGHSHLTNFYFFPFQVFSCYQFVCSYVCAGESLRSSKFQNAKLRTKSICESFKTYVIAVSIIITIIMSRLGHPRELSKYSSFVARYKVYPRYYHQQLPSFFYFITNSMMMMMMMYVSLLSSFLQSFVQKFHRSMSYY